MYTLETAFILVVHYKKPRTPWDVKKMNSLWCEIVNTFMNTLLCSQVISHRMLSALLLSASAEMSSGLGSMCHKTLGFSPVQCKLKSIISLVLFVCTQEWKRGGGGREETFSHPWNAHKCFLSGHLPSWLRCDKTFCSFQWTDEHDY